MPGSRKGKRGSKKNGKGKAPPAKTTEKKQAPAEPSFVPCGPAKDFTQPIAQSYFPEHVEADWNAWWDKQGLFKPDMESDAEPFVMVIPPPNVTGTLHLGHALTCSIEDAVIRYQRMCGKNTLWLPGTDHAGIATQVVVEKKLMRERKITRHVIGREKFLEEVWKWKEASGNHISEQLRMLGASVDWSREVFTMDDRLNEAVKEAFVRMHQDGVIYRAHRLVSWSCALKTAISAIEVETLEFPTPRMVKVPGHDKEVEFGVIHSFAYKMATGEEIVVATTRIETMLGDVAIAVHPKDPRYTKFIGKKVVHPFLPDREMTVVADDILVDMNFGTGAVKITPAHDPNDFECGNRHKLPQINILDDNGLVNENGGKFEGMKRFEVRALVIEELTAMGLYRGKAPNEMSIGFCSRSKDVIEPVVRPQWWVDCHGMAKEAVDAVRTGELQLLPKVQEKTWYRWLENIKDWCISRQLWWGHRIPAYFVDVKGEKKGKSQDEKYWVVARTEVEAMKMACERFGKKEADITLTQDPDVLDTWFSSGLFPFSTMGWPNQTPDLDKFFPGALLETGQDILFFWVARMVMMSLQLTKKLPFKQVFLHSMVRDRFGRKMSKSLGNVVDPLDVINGIELEALHEKLRTGNLDPREVAKAIDGQKRDYPNGISACGSDALRFGLLAYSRASADINLDIQRVIAYRQFCNKLWNATKFALTNFGQGWTRPTDFEALLVKGSVVDKWIMHRLAVTAKVANSCFQNYQFAEATTACYNFWLYDLCDYYLELSKPIVKGQDQAAKEVTLAVLFMCLERGLRLLHPLMPFVTEELFHRIPGHDACYAAILKANPKDRKGCGSIMVQSYPHESEYKHWENEQAQEHFDLLKEIVHKIRSSRASLGLQKRRCDLYLLVDPSVAPLVRTLAQGVASISYANQATVMTDAKGLPAGAVSAPVNANIMVYLPVADLVDLVKESLKLFNQQSKLNAANEKLRELTKGSAYAAKTPATTQAEHQEKLATQDGQVAQFEDSIMQLLGVCTGEQRQAYWATIIKDAEKLVVKGEADLKKIKTKAGDKPNKKAISSIAKATVNLAACTKALNIYKSKSGGKAATAVKGVSKAKDTTAAYGDRASLEKHLASRSFVQGFEPSAADVKVFKEVTCEAAPDRAKFPHTARWFATIAYHINKEKAAGRL